MFLVVVVTMLSCNKEEKIAKRDDDTIKEYIADHGLNATKTDSGLYYVIETPGTGDQPGPTSQVKVAYKGYYTDGRVFDESDSNGIQFGLNQVIEGWTEGIQLFKEGGSGILLIPSALGYGQQGSGSVPPNTVLIFDVALIDVI